MRSRFRSELQRRERVFVHLLLLRCRLPVGLHLHNTRNTGYANALAGLEHGATIFDASVGGLGGCPFAPGASGNIATEELVYLLDDAAISTGVDLDAVLVAAALATELVGHPLESNLFRAGGRNRPRGAQPTG